MNTPKRRPGFQPGQSGNPKGRTPGTSKAQKLRDAIAQDAPAIIQTLTAAALAGDVQAAKVLLERALPALKPQELPAPLALPTGTLTEQGRAVLASVAAGQLGPAQGAQLVTAIGTLARVVEIDELTARIEALESKNAED